MINAGTVTAFLTLDTNRFNAGMESANAQFKALRDENITAADKIQGVGGALTTIGGTLTRNVTLPLVGAGAAALAVAANFDEGMSKVQAISGATGEDLDKLRDKAREMGSKTKFSATEAADAMSYMAMAGWKTGEMLDGIEGIMNLAAASGEDLATTSDIVTDALTAFGLKAKDSAHFSDILAAASSYANTNVSMLGESFKYCAPIAGAMGYSAEDVAEALGLMANSGIKASQAGTALRSIMTKLTGDIKISGKELGEVTIKATNADGSMREMSDILADCRGAFSKLTESEKSANAETLAGKYAMSGFLALMNAAPEDVDKLSGAINNCDGAAEKMAATMQNNLKGQLTVLKSQAEELAIGFGTELMPVAQDLVGVASSAVQAFSGLDDGAKKFIVYAGLAAAAMGPLTTGIGSVVTAGGKLVGTVGTMATAFSAAGGGIAGVGSALTAVIGPAGLALLAIGGVAAVGIALYKDLHRGSEALDEFNQKMEEAKASADELEEINDSLKKLEETRLNNYSNQTEEANTVEHLKNRLKELVDENGRLVGSKDELKSVIKQLNEKGFTVELNKTGDLITNYKTLTGEIEKYVQQKKAQAMLDSLEPDYQNALKEKAKYYSIYVKNLAEMNELQKKLNDDEYLAGLSVAEYKKLCDTYNQLAENANNAFSQYQSSCEVIDAYDKSMAAIAKGDYETAASLLSGYYEDLSNTIKKSGDYAKEEQAKAITELSTQLIQQIQAYGIAMQTGNQAVISDAKTYLEQAAEELEKAGVKLPDSIINGIENGSIGLDEAMVAMAVSLEANGQQVPDEMKKIADETLAQWDNLPEDTKKQMKDVIAGALEELEAGNPELYAAAEANGDSYINAFKEKMGIASPSKVMREIGGYTIEGFQRGLEDKKPDAERTITGIMESMVTAAGAVSFTGVGSGIVSGIIRGMTSGTPRLVAAASGFVSNAVTAAKRALGINSPSRVMMEVGRYTAAGMEVGLMQGSRHLYETASAISDETAAALSGISSGGVNLPGVHSANYGDRLDRLDKILEAVEKLADSQPTVEIDGRPFGRLVREYV